MMPHSTTPSPVRRTPSSEALHSAYLGYQNVRDSSSADGDYPTPVRQRHQQVATHVDAFVRGEGPQAIAASAERLLLQNFATDLPRPFSQLVIECVDDRLRRIDPYHDALKAYTAASLGLNVDDMTQMAQQSARQNLLRLRQSAPAELVERLAGQETITDRLCADLFARLPLTVTPAITLRKLFSSAELLVLLRAPNRAAIAEGNRALAAQQRRGELDLTAPMYNLWPELIAAATTGGLPNTAQAAPDGHFAGLLEALGGRGALTTPVIAAFLPGVTLQPEHRAWLEAGVLDAMRPSLMHCFRDVDVDAYTAYAASTDYAALRARVGEAQDANMQTWDRAITSVKTRLLTAALGG